MGSLFPNSWLGRREKRLCVSPWISTGVDFFFWCGVVVVVGLGGRGRGGGRKGEGKGREREEEKGGEKGEMGREEKNFTFLVYLFLFFFLPLKNICFCREEVSLDPQIRTPPRFDLFTFYPPHSNSTPAHFTPLQSIFFVARGMFCPAETADFFFGGGG